MRILICRSNPIAPDPRVEKIARSLAQRGWEVQILGWDRTGQLPCQEDWGFARLHRLPIRARFGSGLGNLPQLLRWQIGLLTWLIKHRATFDIVHACDFDTVLPVIIVQRLRHKPVIYDIFDFYADHLRRTPEWIKHLIRKVDFWAINQVDAVILADESRREQIRGSHPREWLLIYNSPQDWQPASDLSEPMTMSQSALRIAYVGLLQKERGLLELLEVVKKHPEWHLTLAGFGGDQEEILSVAEHMENVQWYGRVSYEAALDLYARADVLLATYDPGIRNHRFASPNKLFEAMMLGKPMIVAQHTNIDKIVERFGCGMVVPYGDVQALERAFLQLAADPLARQQLGSNGRAAYEQHYHWNIMSDRLSALYRRVATSYGFT